MRALRVARDANNKEKLASQGQAWRFKKKYNITPEQRDERLRLQNNVCAICGTSDPGTNGWAIDHCHTQGHVRGILCQTCNLMLGHAKDNPATLAAAINYLKS